MTEQLSTLAFKHKDSDAAFVSMFLMLAGTLNPWLLRNMSDDSSCLLQVTGSHRRLLSRPHLENNTRFPGHAG